MALLPGVAKARLVDLMGHSSEKMIGEVYGSYRQGLADEKESILEGLSGQGRAEGGFHRALARMAGVKSLETAKAPLIPATFEV